MKTYLHLFEFKVVRQRLSASLIFLLLLTSCTQIKSLPPLPPTVVVGSVSLSIPPGQTTSPVLAGELPTDTPEVIGPDATLSPDEPTLSNQEILQTRTALVDLYAVQTQFALMQEPSLTPTPCPKPPCKSPTPTWSPPKTKTPTLTSTATTQPSILQIVSPGPLSKVVSPIHLVATGLTGAAGMIRVELFAEDGHLIMRQILRYGSMQDLPFVLNLDIPFELSVVAESARLAISVDDSKNRPIALTSAELILLSIGDPQINPSADGLAPIIINQPGVGSIVTSGFMEVKGMVRSISDRPLLLELYTDEGVLVGTRQAPVAATPDGAYHPFEAIVPYIITQSRGARLVIRQESSKIPGNVALSSVTLTIKP